MAKEPKPKKAQPKQKAKSARRAQSSKINWNDAFAWFLGDDTRSYSDVAKQFGVAKSTVERNARVSDDAGGWVTWAERRQLLGEIARKKIEEKYKKSAAYRNEQHILQFRNLQVAVSQKVATMAKEGKTLVDPDTGKKYKVQEFDMRQYADASKALRTAVDGERVAMGMATSVSTIKPGSEEGTGKGWGDLIALAMSRHGDKKDES